MKILTLGLFCIIVTNFCMEVEEVDKKEEWKKIQTWSDVTQFAGRIVAYTTVSPYFAGKKNISINGDNINYGSISRRSTKWNFIHDGYRMSRLLDKKAKEEDIGLIDLKIKDSQLSIRRVNATELEAIRNKVVSFEAKFEGDGFTDFLS